MRADLLVLLLLVPALSGCLAVTSTERACAGFEVPKVRQGDVYEYAFEGRLATLDFEFSLVDFEGVHAGAPRAGSYVFPKGSDLTIVVANGTSPRLDWRGELRASMQAAWLIRSPDFGPRVHAFDEWISPDGGELVQAHTRMMLFNGVEYEHQARTTMNGRPPLLGALAVAGQVLAPEWSRVWELLAEQPLPYVDRHDGEITARVENMEGDPCRATVRFEVVWPRFGSVDLPAAFGTYHITAIYGPDVALPLAYRTTWDGPLNVEPLTLRLVSHLRGTGTEISAFSKAAPGGPVHAPQRTDGGMPADGDCRFGTCLGDASAVLMSNATVASWLRDHPQATLWMLDHVSAEEGSRFRDAWRAVWSDQNESLSATHFAVKDPSATGTLRVSNGGPKDGAGPRRDVAVTIDALADVHALAFGGEAEVLTCYFVTGVCGVGTHQGTGKPRVTDELRPEVGRFPLGVVVGVETGTIHQIHLQGKELLGPTPAEDGDLG